ncbi:MAG: late competence development ComFB family protein [Deltaproteobacteria bacterium]|nr:late competence development ComFB family protein [Deltaproteobacteria bacterium]
MNTKNKYWINDYSLENIRNRQEARVVEFMRKVLPTRKDFCGCRLCVEDAYALTLNTLPAQYSQSGSLVLRSSPPTDTEVLDTLHQSIDKVAAVPNHSKGSSNTGA